jgi:hypothetical protein
MQRAQLEKGGRERKGKMKISNDEMMCFERKMGNKFNFDCENLQILIEK